MDSVKKASANKKRNIILSVVAVIEMVALIIFGVYSWIEGAESAGVKGKNLSRASSPGLIIRFNGDYTNAVDLNAYIDEKVQAQNADEFVLAEASSINGSNMFFRGPQNAAGELTFRECVPVEDDNIRYIKAEFDIMSDGTDSSSADGTNIWLDPNKTYLRVRSTQAPDTFLPDGAIRISMSFDGGTTFKVFGSSAKTISAIKAIDNTGAVLSPVTEGLGTQTVKAFTDASPDKGASAALAHLPSGSEVHVIMYIWLEGQDSNCVDEIASSILDLQLYFTTGFEN